MNLSVVGKVVLVTGASSGLGAHFAQVLAEAGAMVIVGARREEKLQELVEKVSAKGGQISAVALDVKDPNSVKAAFDFAESTYGIVDVLINNAGITGDLGRFTEVTEENWHNVVDTNLNGVWRVAQEATKRMVANQVAGSVVNIASIYGLGVGVTKSAYTTTKAAVVQLTKTMAIELVRKNIRVNALCPGYFTSGMNDEFFATEAGQKYLAGFPSQRLGEYHELNGPLLLLASDASSYMTGVALPVDGGLLVSPI